MYEQSLVIIKPDGIQRRLAAKILQRFEDSGFKIHAMKFVQPTRELAQRHYAEHVSKDFYPLVEDYIVSGPVLVMVLGALDGIARIRTMVGNTIPSNALPGTIRGDFAHQPLVDDDAGPVRNLIHASANLEEAATEVEIWFSDEEIIEYDLIDDRLHSR